MLYFLREVQQVCHTHRMATRQPQAPGGRKIRHVVMVTSEQEQQLQERAAARQISVARLLAESALGTAPDVSAVLLRSVNGLRKMLSEKDSARFDAAFSELVER